MTITLFAIRHKPTGKMLPERRKKGERGYTHTELANPDEQPPRLFAKQAFAKTALRCWLEGRITVSTGGYDSYTGYESDEDWHVEKIPTRKAEDMEIIPVELVMPALSLPVTEETAR